MFTEKSVLLSKSPVSETKENINLNIQNNKKCDIKIHIDKHCENKINFNNFYKAP